MLSDGFNLRCKNVVLSFLSIVMVVFLTVGVCISPAAAVLFGAGEDNNKATVPAFQLGEPQSIYFRVKVGIENRSQAAARDIRVEVPLLAEVDSPYQEIINVEAEQEPREVIAGEMRSRSCVYVIDELLPEANKTIEMEYHLKVYPIETDFTSGVYLTGNYPVDEFLKPQEFIESDHPEIIAAARKITGGVPVVEEKAKKIFTYVKDHMQYDAKSAYRNTGALNALRKGSGVCDDYASLFVALSRAAGIPARKVNGYVDPKGTGELWRLEPAEKLELAGYRHSWAEFYTPERGWVPVDPTMNVHHDTLKYFGSLKSTSHIVQNYRDLPLRVKYRGGELAVQWEEMIVGRQ